MDLSDINIRKNGKCTFPQQVVLGSTNYNNFPFSCHKHSISFFPVYIVLIYLSYVWTYGLLVDIISIRSTLYSGYNTYAILNWKFETLLLCWHVFHASWYLFNYSVLVLNLVLVIALLLFNSIIHIFIVGWFSAFDIVDQGICYWQLQKF